MSAPYVPAGVPIGGTSNQVLAKASNAGYDVHWVTPAAGGGGTPGGTSGQFQFNNAGAFAGAGVTWDPVNSRVGVGVANPSYPFQVNSAAGLVLAADCEATYHSACAPAYGFIGATSADSVFYYSPGSGMVAVQSGEPGGLRLTATTGTGDVALQSAGGSLTVRHDGVAASSGAVQAGGSLRATGNTYSAFTGQGAELYFDPATSTGGFVSFDRTAGAYLGFTADALAHHWKLSGVHGLALLAGPALGIGTAAPQGLLHINGGPLLVGAGSSTGTERVQGRLIGTWADNTDATRKGRVALAAEDWTGTDREGVRVESDGTRPLVGFYGAAAVARPSGGVLAALSGLGLVTSPTLAAGDLPLLGASGAGHAAGAAPDPGATAGIVRFLREDATWAVPSGGGGGNVSTGPFASRPAAGTAGRLYLPTDGTSVYEDSGTAWKPWGPVFPLADPTAQTWTAVNLSAQGAGTLTAQKGGMYIQAVNSGSNGDNWRLAVKPAPTPPYRIVARVLPSLPLLVGGQYLSYGIFWYDSVGGGFTTLAYQTNPGAQGWNLNKYTNLTTFQAGYFGPVKYPPEADAFLFLADDGTNRSCGFSADAQNFQAAWTGPRADFLTPNSVGFGVDPYWQNLTMGVNLIHWSEG